MAKQKIGLQKQVSEIFDGVPILKQAGPHEVVKTLASNHLDFLRPKPPGSHHRWTRKLPAFAWLLMKFIRPKQSKITSVKKAFNWLRQYIFYPVTAWFKG
jgi:hypothetical protein